ncbi:MAG: SurA N-terminal domain-containing protein, partial [Ignavibacteria bacterium]|nr:SurA N-terminal domain-containing protein [Ignavibacteria bacterium]
MMAKMRSLAPAFIISVGVLFVLFMVISDSNVLEALGARSNNVGSVNGKDISYQEFSNFLDRAVENQKAQTGQEIPEENMDQFRDQVWDAIVTQTLTEQQ